MEVEKSIFSDLQEATPEVRAQAMEILRSESENKYQQIENLLGWHEDIGMFQAVMASKLGITVSQLRYYCQRAWLREQRKQARASKRKTNEVQGSVVNSELLGLSMWLPSDWYVREESGTDDDVSYEIKKTYSIWSSYSNEEKLKLAYKLDQLRYPLDEKSFDEFAENASEAIEEEDERLREKMRLKMAQGVQVTYWSAEPREGNEDDSVSVEITKFRLREPMTCLELFYAERPEEHYLQSCSRPANRADLLVDGMQVIKAYYTWRDDSVIRNEDLGPEQLSAYLTDHRDGWAVDFWTSQKTGDSLRPLFHRIVSSLSRKLA